MRDQHYQVTEETELQKYKRVMKDVKSKTTKIVTIVNVLSEAEVVREATKNSAYELADKLDDVLTLAIIMQTAVISLGRIRRD
jgi:hypothetical protein